jgi:hypothetical protein
MIHLNLLSPQKKQQIEWRHIYDLVKRAGLILFVFLILAVSSFATARSMLRNVLEETVDRTALATQRFQQDWLGMDLDKRLQGISEIQSDFIPWSYFIEEIAKDSNQGIKFRSIEINKAKNKINIKGNAAERGNLLDFKQNLEDSKRFVKIIFPINNILKKENVDFTIEAVIDPANIKID